MAAARNSDARSRASAPPRRGQRGLASARVVALCAGLATVAAIVLTIAGQQGRTTEAGGNPWSLYLDCNPSASGIQSNCYVPSGTGTLDVDVVLVNNSAGTEQIGYFNFDVVTDKQLFFNPGPESLDEFNSNPDFNQADVTGTWVCDPPTPDRDSDPNPAVARSFIACFNGDSNGPSVGPGESLKLATVHYDVLGETTATFVLENASVGNSGLAEIMSCNPPIGVQGDCIGADIQAGGTPLPTPSNTPTPTNTLTPTNTPTLTPT